MSGIARVYHLLHFTQRGHATVLTLLSVMLHEYALEFARHWPDQGEPPTLADLASRLRLAV